MEVRVPECRIAAPRAALQAAAQDEPATSMIDASFAQQLAHWRGWIGRAEQRADFVTAAPLAALAATLDRDEPEPPPGSDVPPMAHWLYFLPVARHSEIGPDGHPLRGGFLPPVPLPRRMWAGGRLAFHHPLQVGDEVTRTSRILQVDAKEGRSGRLVFVTVRHEIANARGTAVVEEHDIVYRDLPRPGAAAPVPEPAPADASFSREITPDPVLLFRYSALTFNGHRIHYDRRYVTETEGYPGLVVHGPLIATLLVDLLRRERPHARLRRFAFTAVRPTFDGHPFRVCGRDDGHSTHALWACDHEGLLTMRAEATTE
jgi:3-methylfumaryl-CoA hydratase